MLSESDETLKPGFPRPRGALRPGGISGSPSKAAILSAHLVVIWGHFSLLNKGGASKRAVCSC